MAKGILSNPPKKGAKANLERVSPGIYRNTKTGALVNSATGTPKAAAKTKAKNKTTAAYKGLTSQQTQAIKQQEAQDVKLGKIAGGQIENIEQAYAQPFDWQALPQAPTTDQYGDWFEKSQGDYQAAFDNRMNPVFQQQSQDFDQQMADRGIPVGSELYNQQKGLLAQSQNDARQQAYAAGQSQAMQTAQGAYGIGTDARSRAYQEAQAGRNMPLSEYQALMGSRSGMPEQNLAFNQALKMPRGGGAGDPYNGMGNYQNLAAFDDARKIALAQQMAKINQGSQPSTGSIIGGQAVGTGLGLLGGFLGGLL
jgi:hypothetical protein